MPPLVFSVSLLLLLIRTVCPNLNQLIKEIFLQPAARVGNMKRILYSDWLPKGASCVYLGRWGSPTVNKFNNEEEARFKVRIQYVLTW